MISYISGEASRAVFVEKGKYYGISLDSREDVLQILPAQLHAFLMHSADVEVEECESRELVVQTLEMHWARDRSHRMVLMAFDSTEDIDLRRRAAKIAESRLRDMRCLNFTRNILYSRPMPALMDCFEIEEFLSRTDVPLLEELFQGLVYHQDRIIGCSDAWDEIAPEVFAGPRERAEFRARVVKSGVFYDLSMSEGEDRVLNNCLFTILADSVVGAQNAKARAIVSSWVKKYRVNPKKSYPSFSELGERELWRDEPQQRVPGYIMFERVKKQRAAIERELLSTNFDRADRLIDELVASQRVESSAEHLAKSLCALSMFCKDLGDRERYRSLAERAVVEAPFDAWAHIQLGNSRLAVFRYRDALSSFENAAIYGDERSAMIGKAEALKYLGSSDDAIKILDECILKYPGDMVAANSRASILAYSGDFERAISEYSEIISSPFASAHAYGGRASAYVDLGRFKDALPDHEMAIHLAKEDPISYCALADTKRQLFDWDGALAVLAKAPRTVSSRLLTGIVEGRILRDQGRFGDALSHLAEIRSSYPLDISVQLNIADIMRLSGDYLGAASEYRRIEGSLPHSKIARNSLASSLAALGQLDDALIALPLRLSSSKYDWWGQLVRALILMRQDDIWGAEKLLMEGVSDCPWRSHIPHFSAALSLVRLKTGASQSAQDVLSQLEDSSRPPWMRLFERCSGISREGRATFSQGWAAYSLSIPAVTEFENSLGTMEIGGIVASNDLIWKGWEALLALAA